MRLAFSSKQNLLPVSTFLFPQGTHLTNNLRIFTFSKVWRNPKRHYVTQVLWACISLFLSGSFYSYLFLLFISTYSFTSSLLWVLICPAAGLVFRSLWMVCSAFTVHQCCGHFLLFTPSSSISSPFFHLVSSHLGFHLPLSSSRPLCVLLTPSCLVSELPGHLLTSYAAFHLLQVVLYLHVWQCTHVFRMSE